VGLALLALASFGCALVADYGLLLALRVLQGIGAGASTVISPSVIKSTLGERDAHRGIAAVAMIEAIVPAAGPVLGTLLLLAVDWPWTFAAIGVLTLLSAPLALRVIPHASPAGDDAGSGYAALLRDRRFLRLASAHALSFAALFVFVGSGPQVLNPAWGLHAFALAQVVGVACFIAAASQSGKLGERLGTGRVVKAGAWLHLALCLLFLGCIALGIAPFGAVPRSAAPRACSCC
jgi:MFS family permease